jgi:uncharacterized protein YqfA (UPF0365 family)
VFIGLSQFAALAMGDAFDIGGITAAMIVALAMSLVFLYYGALWIQAYMSDADVSVTSLIRMSCRRVKPSVIVTAKIMARQAGLSIDRQVGVSTVRLEGHVLAGGDVMRVLRAVIAAHLAGIDLDFERAAAIDLAGRDVVDAVRTSVLPKVIDCPDRRGGGRSRLTGVARNGVELRVGARVTVRTNLDQLIGGATEETVIARVGQGIISAIGAAQTHMEVLEMPDRISRSVLARGLDTNTAFEIVSIDVADIEVGDNIGARLQSDQAEADVRVARATAEARRASAIARQQEMKAKLAESRAILLLAEAAIPSALAVAFRAGRLQTQRPPATQGSRRGARDSRRAFPRPDPIANPRQAQVDCAPPSLSIPSAEADHE